MDKTKVVINAVHERDAEAFWKSLELKETEKCLICSCEVTATSFAAIGVYKGNVVVCCEKGNCFYDFSSKIHGDKK
jgi:hypothetical protein